MTTPTAVKPRRRSDASRLLPLRWKTPVRWTETALSDPLALLGDQAHLEKKAAVNAVELLDRWPTPAVPEEWSEALSGVVRDEAAHLREAVRLLTSRGQKLDRVHRNDYAADLHKLVRRGQAWLELLDR